jgi:tetratricopeptide (TPR) repeat protein
VNVALHDAAEEVAEAAAVAVSGSEHPDTEAAFTKALDDAPDFASWCRAADAMTGYARGLERPAMPSLQTEMDDEGNIVLRFQGGGGQKIRPELLAPIAARAVEADDPDVMRKVVTTSLQSRSGTLALADRVNALIDDGGYERAIEIANVALAHWPELSRVYWWRARALEGLGRADYAITDYGRVVELVPQFSEAWSRRSTLLHLRGDDAGAVQDLDAFLDLEPNDIPARRKRAMLHYQLSEYTQAIEDLDILVANGENSADAHLIHASCLLNLNRYAESEAAASRAIALDPDSAEPLLIRGNARFELGHHDDAIADFDRAMALEPTDTRAAEWRAYVEKSKSPG